MQIKNYLKKVKLVQKFHAFQKDVQRIVNDNL